MMSKPFRRIALAAAATLLSLIPTSCTEKESELGLGLSNSNSIYDGKTDTLYANTAISLRDSAITTGGFDYNIVGNYTDATFGTISAELFTQVALPSNTSTINFDSVVVDSVVLILTQESLYPDSGGTYQFHFEVMQLAEAISSVDSLYHGYSTLPVNPDRLFFDSTLTIDRHDSLIHLRLGGGITSAINFTGNNEDFVDFFKGLRIRLEPSQSNLGMLTLNFAATNTRLSAYYHYGNDTNFSSYEFTLAHPFMHYSHDYTAAEVGNDSIDGASKLYLEPLGGYRLRIGFDSALSAFHAAHPLAVIHSAELILPVANGDWGAKPDRIIATYTAVASGREGYINDYLHQGVDGYYHADDNAYHLRLPRHMQSLLRSGTDRGTFLSINSRRNSAARIVLNGIRGDNPARISFVYTE